MKFNPEAKHPYVPCSEIYTLICDELHGELEKLLKCVTPHKPYYCYDAKYKTLLDILDYYGIVVKNIPTRRKADGYYDCNNAIIYVRKEHNNSDSNHFYSIMSHELGHVLQGKLGLLWMFYSEGYMSSLFRMEQQCEAIAEIICGCFFDLEYNPSYRNVEDAKYLRKYSMNGWIKDDLLIKGKEIT